MDRIAYSDIWSFELWHYLAVLVVWCVIEGGRKNEETNFYSFFNHTSFYAFLYTLEPTAS